MVDNALHYPHISQLHYPHISHVCVVCMCRVGHRKYVADIAIEKSPIISGSFAERDLRLNIYVVICVDSVMHRPPHICCDICCDMCG